MSEIDAWATEASATFRDLVGEERSKELEHAWQTHAARTAPVVTIYGPYDSGKSSLLKRFLVDEHCPVPSWLAIGARRTTFEIDEVDGCRCVFRDTPGIAGGSREHELLASSAVALADVVLLVLPPQLLTSERDDVVAVLSGRAFHPAGLPLGRALIVAIGRMEEAGRDPADGLDAYYDLASKKKQELLASLGRTGVTLDVDRIHTVAADPYALVGSRSATAADFDEFRAWDGVATLRAALETVADHLPQLRLATRLRFWSAALRDLKNEVARELDEKSTAEKEGQNALNRFALLEEQLDELCRAAKSGLRGVIEEQLASAATARFTDASQLQSHLKPRVEQAFGHWKDDQDAALRKLAADAEAEMEARRQSPGARAFRFAVSEAADDKDEAGPWDTLKRARKIGPALKKGVRQWHEQKLGMTLKKARDELKLLDEIGPFARYLETKGRRKGLQSNEHVTSARRIVNLHRTIDLVGPALSELGGLLLDEAKRREQAAANARRREELRNRIRDAAETLASEYWEEWCVAAEELRAWFREQVKPYEAAVPVLAADKAALEGGQRRIETLLTHAVTLAGRNDT